MTNFTITDIVGATRAALGFPALLVAPGYLAATGLNLFGFRSRSFAERIAWGIALSFAISPILINLSGRLVPLGAVAAMFGLAALGFVAVSIVSRRQIAIRLDRYTILLGLFLLVATAVVIGELIDLQSGPRLYLSVTTLDQAYRVAFVNAVAHTGIPPLNPLYHPGASSPMRYYYFWYALCAIAMKLLHVSARQALIASSVWGVVGLTAVIALFARHFLQVREGLRRYILVASLLLTVTGLDILPVFYNLFANHDFSGDLEWWSGDQISSWLDTILWVPNHLAATLCCLTSFLLLWRARDEAESRHRVAATVLAGVAAASAFGLSVYVTAGFAMLMLGWVAILVWRDRDRVPLQHGAVAAGVSALLLVPYLRELLSAASGTQGRAAATPTHLFQFGVRGMIDPELITYLPRLARLREAHPTLLDQAVRLLLLLPGYAIELGVFGLALVLTLRSRASLDPARRTALGFAVGGLILVGFVRSAVIGNNDFGYRAALLPCFFLLLLAAECFAAPSPRPQNAALWLLLLVGLAGTGFQALMLRVYVPLHAGAKMAGFEHLPEAAFAVRSAYADAAQVMPPGAILQSNLYDPADYLYSANMLYAERSMVTDATEDCGAVFGGDPALCSETQQQVVRLFASPAPSAVQAQQQCRAWGATYLAVASTDPAWSDRNGWVWTLPAVAETPSISPEWGTSTASKSRVVNCGSTFTAMH